MIRIAIALATLFVQQPPAPRRLGPITAVSTEPLASVATAVAVQRGAVYANDIVAHRVLLFDSTLAHVTVIADSTETGNFYGARPATLLAFGHDTALLITPAELTMLVLTPGGTVARALATPPNVPMGGGVLVGGIFGLPSIDATGRMVYYSPGRVRPRLDPAVPNPPADSAFVVRFDFTTRRLDTAGTFKIPKSRAIEGKDAQGNMTSLTSVAFPPQVVDDWAVTSDGVIAILRGQDYHVDILGRDGKWTPSPRMPYTWERIGDDEKNRMLDSARDALQIQIDTLRARADRARASGGGGGGGRGRDGGDAGRPPGPGPTLIAARAELSDVPDYRPPFRQGSLRADMNGNLWVRTNTMVNGQPVYDVVNRKGELADRVLLPPFRTIAGFGPGIVYLAVKDSVNVVHLERARIR